MYYVTVNHGSIRGCTDVSGHVTLHFEFQQCILEVRYSLPLLLYTLAST